MATTPLHTDTLTRFHEAVGDGAPFERLFAEASVRLAEGDAAGAEGAFAAATEGEGAMDRPFFLKAWHGRGLALLELGRADEAVPIFAALVDARPDLLAPSLQLGLALLACGRPGEAHLIHEQALSRHSEHDELGAIFADGAVALDALERWQEGRQWCERGIAALPSPPVQLHLNLATFHFRLGDKVAARQTLLAAVAADPEQAHVAHTNWADWGDGSPL